MKLSHCIVARITYEGLPKANLRPLKDFPNPRFIIKKVDAIISSILIFQMD